MKKIGFVLLLISFGMITVGILDYVFVGQEKAKKVPSTEKPKTIPNSNILYNNNPKIKKEHCFEGICYTIDQLSYLNDTGEITVKIKNNNYQKVTEGYVKFVFEASNGNEVFIYHPPLEANSSDMTVSILDNGSIIEAKDYTIVPLTAEDMQKVS